MFPARTFKGKRVGLFGLARSGLACLEALQLGGAEVIAWDDSEEAVAKAAGAPVADLRTIDFRSLDALVLSPGVPLTHPAPHWAAAKAREAGIEVIGDTEVFAREIAGTGALMVAITGTNGKSTTTALAWHVLKAAGFDADVGGNIGTAAFLMRPPEPGRIYVLELSSFQIDLMPSLKPAVGILTNITPDHLDRHGSIENYAEVKSRMFARQGEGDTALVNYDDMWCAAIAKGLGNGSDVRAVSVARKLADGISAKAGLLRDMRGGEEIACFSLLAMPALKGAHNWQNACMAYGAARALGADAGAIEAGMRSFPGLRHRMQQVAIRNGVAYVNDSKATNADAAAKALAAFDRIHWIAGGVAKAGGIESLSEYFPRIAKAYLIGEAAQQFARTLDGKVDHEMSGTLDAALSAAARDAKPGSVVLLSPACSSFDHYRNFEVRGDAFVGLVAALPGAHMADLGGL
jgi:UDP-N-acetylmuramoylalanine--D-glutamate ligase